MNKPEPLPVATSADAGVTYVQIILGPEDAARLDAVVQRGGFKKGAFAAIAVMERVAKFERERPSAE